MMERMAKRANVVSLKMRCNCVIFRDHSFARQCRIAFNHTEIVLALVNLYLYIQMQLYTCDFLQIAECIAM